MREEKSRIRYFYYSLNHIVTFKWIIIKYLCLTIIFSDMTSAYYASHVGDDGTRGWGKMGLLGG